MEEILVSLREKEGLKSVCISLPEEQIYIFNLKLEKSGLENIRKSIEISLKEHIPITAQDTIFDYDLLYEDEQNLKLHVVAISKTVIEKFLTVFRNSNIFVKSFEFEAQAITRAVIKKGDLETYMIVDFGKKRTGIFIISQGVAMFASTLDVGGDILTSMIEKTLKISFEEAEKKKREYGLKNDIKNKEITVILLKSITTLRDEIVKHFLHWHTHKDEEGKDRTPIKKIILCGGDSNLIGLSDYLSVEVKVDVEIANTWINMIETEKYIPEISLNQSLAFATAIGLTLEDFEYD